MRDQAQLGRGDRITLATQILRTHDIPQTVTYVIAAIGQSGHTAGCQRVRALLPPGREIRPTGFVQNRTRGIECTELPATLQIRLDNLGDPDRGLIVASESDNGEGQLNLAHTGDLDPELGQGRRCAEPGQGGEAQNMPSVVSILIAHVAFEYTNKNFSSTG